jgi:hypothetical protein
MAGYYEGDFYPTCSSGNNGFGSNGWGDLAALIVVAGLFGWGNGGFGFGGNRGYDFGCGAPATQADLANGFAQNTLQRGIDDIILGQATMQNFINQGFSGLNATVTNGFAGVNNAVCTLGYQQAQLVNGLSRELAECCCSTGRAIDSVKYENAKNTCDIIRAGQDNTRAILDYLSGEKIASLQAENAGLKAQISNDRQSMYITDTILDKLSPCPRPAYLTCDPRLPYGYPYGVGNGCCGASVQ